MGNEMEENGMEQIGTGWNGMEQKWNGREWKQTKWNMEQNII